MFLCSASLGIQVHFNCQKFNTFIALLQIGWWKIANRMPYNSTIRQFRCDLSLCTNLNFCGKYFRLIVLRLIPILVILYKIIISWENWQWKQLMFVSNDAVTVIRNLTDPMFQQIYSWRLIIVMASIFIKA